MSFVVPLGPFSQNQSRHQASHASGFARQHPGFFIEITDGNIHEVNILDIPYPGSRVFLHHGPRLSGLRTFVCHTSSQCLLYRPCQVNLQYRRLYSRVIDKTTGLRCDQTIVLTVYQSAGLSRETSADQILRFRTQPAFDVLDQQFCHRRLGHRSTLQSALENRTVFQMDQTTPAYQSIFRTSENAVKTQIWIAVSIYVLIAIIKKRLDLEPELLQNSTNFERDQIRENACFSSTYEN